MDVVNNLPSEALRLYLTEVKDSHQGLELDDEHVLLNGKTINNIF